MDCLVPLSVKYLLVECPNLLEKRRLYLYKNNRPPSLKVVIGEEGMVAKEEIVQGCKECRYILSDLKIIRLLANN